MAKKRKKRRRKKKKLGFKRLATEVTREYLRKGYSAERARKIGNATAAKVEREKGYL